VALRVTLQMILLGLLAATVLAIGIVNYLSARQSTEVLERDIVGASARAVEGRVMAFLEPGPRTLTDLEIRSENGRLPLDDFDVLGAFFADRLRYERTLSRLQYADAATGALVSASRDEDNQILLLVGDLKGGGVRDEWVVLRDGARRPHPVSLPPFEPRERPWYRMAADSTGIVWLDRYQSVEGETTVTASVAVNDLVSGAVRGVFNVQYFTDMFPSMLRDAVGDRSDTQSMLFTRRGELIATGLPTNQERHRALLAALPAPPDELPLNQPIPVQFTYAGVPYVGAVQGFRIGGVTEWFAGFVLPEASVLQAVYDTQRMASLMGLGFLALGLLLGTIIAVRIARPLRTIADDLLQVAQFRLARQPSPQSFVREVAVVADAVDRMKASLRSFGRYVPADLVREMLAHGQEARLGGETRELTIHFSDIESFTTLSEHLTPTELVGHLAEYLDGMSETIRDHEGTIDKFIGDGIMAFWNAPNAVPDHAAQGCRAALRAQERLAALRPRWEAAGQPVFKARIGLHTGEVIVGNFGTEERFAYTAMGDSVNLASRLEGQNKAYGTYICASQAVRDAAGPDFEWRRLDRVAVVGRREGTDVYELLGERGTVAPEMLAARDRYEVALAAYFARRFDEAAVIFREALELRPGDKAAIYMAGRADDLAGYPPPPDWTGVFVSTSK
jgi:adenylate cyclase